MAASEKAVLAVWAKPLDELAADWGVDLERGLSADAARARLERDGPNELLEVAGRSPWRIFFAQLTSTLVVVLIAAGVLSSLLGDQIDAIAIGVIVLLNALLGFRQEYRAEKAVAALRKLSVPTVKVLRDGVWSAISAREVVVGDVVLLEAGDAVAADGRLVRDAGFAVQEAALTGESQPVDKLATTLPAATPLAERRNMVYRGTLAVHGHATVLVTATGMATEIGRIAHLLGEVERQNTPLQRRLQELGRRLVWTALFLVTVVLVLGLARGEEWRALLLTALSLAVAAVPEGLPAVLTIALALGAQRMLARRALVRRLPAVETLGSVTVICSDKTGTLTRNQMAVDQVASAAPALTLLGAALCNDVGWQGGDEEPIGDPTEIALRRAAHLQGLDLPQLAASFPRVAEIPFDSATKRMLTLHEQVAAPAGVLAAEWAVLGEGNAGGGWWVAAKGALEQILPLATRVVTAAGLAPLDAEQRRRLQTEHDLLAQAGQRVLAVALARHPSRPAELERDLILVGLLGLIDPPRDAVSAAIETCHAAGIRLVMITGDHPLTAAAIARAIGFPASRVLTGAELDQLDEEAFARAASEVSVYARVTPEHKLRLVETLKAQNQVVAMTGDGVNDAPALKRADIGVAMGRVGTEVAKEAGDIVLLDDDFASIVAAVEEGRRIYDNLRKFLQYLLASNVGELAVMLLGPLLGLPLPLLPLQILWMNLVTDGLPALALGFEPAEPHVMRRPPYPPHESVFARGLLRDILWIGLASAAIALTVGLWYYRAGNPAWQTMLFTVMVVSQIGFAMVMRSERHGWWSLGAFSNAPMLAAVALSTSLQALLLYVPALANLFRLQPLTLPDLAVAVAAATLVPGLVEAQKAWRLLRARRAP